MSADQQRLSDYLAHILEAIRCLTEETMMAAADE